MPTTPPNRVSIAPEMTDLPCSYPVGAGCETIPGNLTGWLVAVLTEG